MTTTVLPRTAPNLSLLHQLRSLAEHDDQLAGLLATADDAYEQWRSTWEQTRPTHVTDAEAADRDALRDAEANGGKPPTATHTARARAEQDQARIAEPIRNDDARAAIDAAASYAVETYDQLAGRLRAQLNRHQDQVVKASAKALEHVEAFQEAAVDLAQLNRLAGKDEPIRDLGSPTGYADGHHPRSRGRIHPDEVLADIVATCTR